ncbi:PTS sugar transporter subunit IIA, partial [Staphylococcus epidermidis]|uniref:PTS sugar transporter subunit IIA n=1 Tax=Staphylococcus epidermidis TaxID=1282 RepID=UPI0021B418B1
MVFHKSLIEITKQPITTHQPIHTLLTNLSHPHYITNIQHLTTPILKPHPHSTTPIPINLPIPHPKSHPLKPPILPLLNHKPALDSQSLHQSNPHLIFLIPLPNHNNHTHLKLLQPLSPTLIKHNTPHHLIHAQSPHEI